MQYIWCHRLWLQPDMVTTDGRPVQVIDPGRPNSDSGPDFFNAKVSIGGEVWVGNVEIHVRASDWYRHGHDGDPAYDNVILHVVDVDDAAITLGGGETVPQMRMPCSPGLSRDYGLLVGGACDDRHLSCAGELAGIDSIYVRDWLDALAFERLNDKVDRIEGYLSLCGGDWDQAAFAAVARSFGSGINGDMFERTALSLPLKVVSRHRDSSVMADALMFGQARLLDDAPAGTYADSLRREYAFLRAKFGLVQPQGILWKMSRMRPAGFPHRRVAQLSRMLQESTRLMSRAIDIARDADPLAAARRWVDKAPDSFWSAHYTFAEPGAPAAPAVMSTATVATVIINAVVPLVYAYGLAHGNPELSDRALDLMHSLPAENNAVTRMFAAAGIRVGCAADSQAVIQMRRCYCEQRKCLYCRIGHRVLAGKARRR